MFGRYIALAACVCLFAALVATGFKDESVAPDGAWVPKQSAASATSVAPRNAAPGSDADWYAGSHTLTREFDGHFYASARVNGSSLRMMVDTGASVIALTGSDARAAGLYWNDSEVRPIGRGASGDVYGVVRTLDVVDIGGFTRRNVRAIVVPQGLDVSLLGQSYLGQIASVEIQGNQMRLSGG